MYTRHVQHLIWLWSTLLSNRNVNLSLCFIYIYLKLQSRALFASLTCLRIPDFSFFLFFFLSVKFWVSQISCCFVWPSRKADCGLSEKFIHSMCLPLLYYTCAYAIYALSSSMPKYIVYDHCHKANSKLGTRSGPCNVSGFVKKSIDCF